MMAIESTGPTDAIESTGPTVIVTDKILKLTDAELTKHTCTNDALYLYQTRGRTNDALTYTRQGDTKFCER